MSRPDVTRDRTIIANPGTWPLVDVLPMKRLTDDGDAPLTGYLIPTDRTTVRRTVPATLRGHADERFDCVEAMLDAGWRVD